jgi:hypothetical protein
MSEVDALAVLQGKVQCEDCFWLTKNAMKDEAFKIRIDRQLEKEHLLEVPKCHLGKCVKRISLSEGIFLCNIEDKIPPKVPSPKKWRNCAWFIPFTPVIQQGGGVAAGLLRAIEQKPA